MPGSWEMGSHCCVCAKARPQVLRGPVRVFQGLKLIWAVASAERLPWSPGMQRPWGQCQHWDRLLLPRPLVQMHLAWLLGGEITVGGEGWPMGG